MIKKKTVFVLGAGASAHLGFPTANGLRRAILSGKKVLLERYGFTAQLCDAFLTSFKESANPSIDAYLELHREHEEIGKVAIAHHLIAKENHDSLFRYLVADANTLLSWGLDQANWYEYLFRLFRMPTLPEFWMNEFFFITFNYDRSLEHYFGTVLSQNYDQPYQLMVNYFSQRVFHVHGYLAPLNMLPAGRPYRFQEHPDIVRFAAKHIKTAHEEFAEEVYMGPRVDALSKLVEAERIFFLGFGYDPANLVKLDFHIEGFRGLKYGTSKDLVPGERRIIEQRFWISLPETGFVSIETLLRNYLPLAAEEL